jgi:murein DD-endopeptidase MepM/ murein hydrolase activator NlpD
MIAPYDGVFRLVSPYGNRIDPITGESAWHSGIDLVGEDSKEIRAVMGGTVLRSRMVTDRSDRTWEWGNYVSVAGDDGMMVYYCHLSSRTVEAGQRIECGGSIGTEGSTGRSTGSHLHLEVRTGGYDTVPAAEYIGIPNLCGVYGHGSSEDLLPDKTHEWAREAVRWAIGCGIILGDGTGDYMLDRPCTREQMCVFLHRMYQIIEGKEGK